MAHLCNPAATNGGIAFLGPNNVDNSLWSVINMKCLPYI